jgi:hypothetical protein
MTYAPCESGTRRLVLKYREVERTYRASASKVADSGDGGKIVVIFSSAPLAGSGKTH